MFPKVGDSVVLLTIKCNGQHGVIKRQASEFTYLIQVDDWLCELYFWQFELVV